MRYWTGLLLVAGAAWLLRSALARRARVLAARAEGRGAPSGGSLAMLGARLPSLIVAALIYLGIKMSVAYYAFGSQVLSLFDLAGLYALLAAYGTFVTCAVRYREPLPAARRAEPAPARVEAREHAKAA